jgi:hypothetical protein
MFEFKDFKSNKAYTFDEINEIAAKFWGVDIDYHNYATPDENEHYNTNWMEILYRVISSLYYIDLDGSLNYSKADGVDKMYHPIFSFETIILQYISSFGLSDTFDSLESSLKWHRPYIELYYHLKSINISVVVIDW